MRPVGMFLGFLCLAGVRHEESPFASMKCAQLDPALSGWYQDKEVTTKRKSIVKIRLHTGYDVVTVRICKHQATTSD
jgi:hypothetical protein